MSLAIISKFLNSSKVINYVYIQLMFTLYTYTWIEGYFVSVKGEFLAN